MITIPAQFDIVRWSTGHPDQPGRYLAAWPDGTVETIRIGEDELSEHGEWTARANAVVRNATHWAYVPIHPDHLPEVMIPVATIAALNIAHSKAALWKLDQPGCAS